MKKSLFKIIILSLFSVLVITMGLFFSINVYAEIKFTQASAKPREFEAHPDFSVAAPLTAIATHREWSATTYPKILHTR